MNKIKQPTLLASAALFYASIFGSNAVNAQSVNLSSPNEIADYTNFGNATDNNLNLQTVPNDPMGQVTNVNQLRDVAPTDWAYEALRSLVDRYGCISGFPNQTYRGNQPLSRYEFAAGLNSCLNQIERLIASSGGSEVDPADVEATERLSQEFEGELASLGGRVDEVESRTAIVEDNQFSTTTKLVGEVAFNLAQAFGDEQALSSDDNPDLESEVVFTDRVRLQLVSSFTGKDQLFTRLTAGNIGNSFQNETGTREGRFAFDGLSGNNIILDRLHYSFPAFNDKLRVTAMASLAAHHFYANTFNAGLDVGGGATGALTRFGERNPIYRQGLANSSAGLGASYEVNDFITLSGGYIAPNGADPNEGDGLFNGSFSALGQIEITPIEPLQIGLTYVRGYDNEQATLNDDGVFSTRGSFLFGATGTNAANFEDADGNTIIGGSPVTTNSIGVQFQYDLNPRISIRGWGGYTDASIINVGDDENGDADIYNYAAAFVVSDILTEGSLAALIVGAAPYLTAIDTDGDGEDDAIENDVPIHLEGFYKYQFNDNISITPGIVWLPTPNQDGDNSDIFIGTVRTTFTF